MFTKLVLSSAKYKVYLKAMCHFVQKVLVNMSTGSSVRWNMGEINGVLFEPFYLGISSQPPELVDMEAELQCGVATKALKTAHKIVSSDPLSIPCPHQPLWAEWSRNLDVSGGCAWQGWSHWHGLAGVTMLLHQLTEARDMSPAGDIPPHLSNMLFPWKWRLLR